MDRCRAHPGAASVGNGAVSAHSYSTRRPKTLGSGPYRPLAFRASRTRVFHILSAFLDLPGLSSSSVASTTKRQFAFTAARTKSSGFTHSMWARSQPGGFSTGASGTRDT